MDWTRKVNPVKVSLVPTPIGTTITLQAPMYTVFAAQSDPAAMFVVNAPIFLFLHKMTTVIAQIADMASQVSPPTGEPNDVQVILNAIQPNSSTLTSLETLYNYEFVVTDGLIEGTGAIISWVSDSITGSGSDPTDDPTIATDFQFTGQAGSPNFDSIVLPSLPDAVSYDLRYETAGEWSSFQSLQPGALQTFGSGVNGIEFVPVDAGGNAIMESNFVFDASFASTGMFSGTLTLSTVTPPLPPVLNISVVGNQLILSWNTNSASGYELVTSTSLTPPINWVLVTNTPTVVSNQFVVTLPIGIQTQFFEFLQFVPPVLQISLLGNQVNLAWNTNNSTGFGLLTTTNLVTPINWISVTNIPSVIGKQSVVTLPVVNRSQFFRLNK
jgi:hypothetical protein